MSDIRKHNKQWMRDLFAGAARRHGFVYQPQQVSPPELGDYTLSLEPVEKWVPALVENYRREVASVERHQDDSVPLARCMTATQLFAQAFGCKVHIPPGDAPCALPMVGNAAEADKLEMPDIWKSPCLYRVFEMGRALQRELGKDVDLGTCDMQTGFDIACQIWDKGDLLCAMIQEPEAVKRLSAKCALLLKTFLVELRKEFPTMNPCHCPGQWVPPELGPWVSNDEVGILSPEMFEEFCLPELNDLSDAFGGIAMHCCADAEHQFPGFRKIRNFYGFNRVQSKHGYLPLLDHFAGPAAPVHCLAWVGDEIIEELVTKAPAGSRFVFVMMGGDDEEAGRWLEKWRC